MDGECSTKGRVPPFIKPEGSLPCSQEHAAGTYLEPDESSPHLHFVFEIRFYHHLPTYT
jgi:hypothetical protein